MVTRIVLALLVSALQAVPAPADDPDRARRARVALVLAGAQDAAAAAVPAPAVAPPPRPADPKLSYGRGYARSAAEQLPLVVFVGCDAPSPAGAVTARAETFGDVRGPATLVITARGSTAHIEQTLPGVPDAAAVQRAVDAAKRKIDSKGPVKAMPATPAPKPLDWQIRAVPANGFPIAGNWTPQYRPFPPIGGGVCVGPT